MLLITKISYEDILNYKEKIIDCLVKNHGNSYINKIIVFIDALNNSLPELNKIQYILKKDLNYKLLAYAKKISNQNLIIWAENDQFFSEYHLKKIKILNNNNYEEECQKYKIFNRNNIDILEKIKKEQVEIVFRRESNNIVIQQPDEAQKEKKSQSKLIEKLDVIIISVDYNDFLIITLQNNKKIFDNIHVVTSENDFLCQKICKNLDVDCIITDIMYEDGAKFNKGKAINYAIDKIKPEGFILLLDADIIVENKIELSNLKSETLYTSGRYLIKDYEKLKNYQNENEIQNFPYERDEGIGFFQLFYNSGEIYPEFSNDASWSDLVFRDGFKNKTKTENVVIHLGHTKKNWSGRITNKFLSNDELEKQIFDIDFDLNSYFDKIYCLNLETRKDRWNKVCNQFYEAKINVERWKAIPGKDISDELFLEYNPNQIRGIKASILGIVENKNALGCLLSHIEIIRDAKLKGFRKILIFEDDIIINKNINSDFKKIKGKNWKLLYLGASQFDWNGIETVNGFYNCNKTLGTFAYAIDSSLYDEIIERFESEKKSIDNLLSLLQSEYYNHCYTFSPNIVISDVEESDIRTKVDIVEYSNKVKWDIERFDLNDKNNFNKLVSENIIEIEKISSFKSNKKTILFIINLNDTGGAEYVSYQHIKACKELGYNVIVVSTGKGMFFEKTKLLDVDLYYSKLNEINKSKVYEVLDTLTDGVDVVYNCFGISEIKEPINMIQYSKFMKWNNEELIHLNELEIQESKLEIQESKLEIQESKLEIQESKLEKSIINREIALSNLIQLDQLFNELKVEYWLTCGTLLGFYRDNDFIAHDKDTDICVNSDHFNGYVLKRILSIGFEIINYFGIIKDGFEISLRKNGVKTDIFLFYKTDDKWYNSVYADFTKKDYLKFDYVYEPFKISESIFLGYKFKTPQDIESFLIQQYGEDFRTPNKKWLWWESPENIVRTGIRVKKNNSDKSFNELLNFDKNIYLNNLTILIKSFLRKDCVDKLISSIRKYYPKIKILIIDDSNDDSYNFNYDENIKTHQIEFDSGLSKGRNIGVSLIETEFFLLLDDDFEFNENTDLIKWMDIMIESNLDILGADVIMNDEKMEYFGNFEIINKCLYYRDSRYEVYDRYKTCDFVLNFFIAKTSKIKKYPWDDDLKLAEHTAFFFEHKGKLKVGHTDEISIIHQKVNEGDYSIYRKRGQLYFQSWMRKKNIDKTINLKGQITKIKL